MRTVFLDFDGVLNHAEWLKHQDDGPPFDPACVARVARVCRETKASIVVSSAWRCEPHPRHRLEWLRGLLRGIGLGAEVIGHTPEQVGRHGALYTAPSRETEIRAYLTKRPSPYFVILDDDADAEIEGHFVKTDFATGITDRDVEAAIEILKKPAPTFEKARGR